MPVLLLLLLAIGDFGRIFTAEIAVQAGAREAADYGAFTASQWDTSVPGQITRTENEMIKRACAAVDQLPDYTAGSDPALCSAAGSNPLFSYRLEYSAGTSASDCGNPSYEPPCVVHVTMTYTYHTFLNLPAIPVLNFSPYPATITLQRDARFSISDIQAPN